MNASNHGRFATLLALTLICGVCLGLLLPRNERGLPRDQKAVTAMAYQQETEIFAATPAQTTESPIPTQENLFAIDTPPSSALSPEASLSPSASAPAAANNAFTIEVLASPNAATPQKRILIYHTHTYEAYRKLEGMNYQETQQWRTADENYNVVRVGEELSGLLRGLGFVVEHDATAFEPPQLSSAYARSLGMLEKRRAAGEAYDLCIDLHRDAYIATQTGDNTVNVGETELARLMVLIGKGEGQTSEGFEERPDWENNLRIAQTVTDALNAQVRGLCKDVRLKSGRYNQHMGVGCMLIEVGNNQNSLPQTLAAMPYLADAIAQTLSGNAGE